MDQENGGDNVETGGGGYFAAEPEPVTAATAASRFPDEAAWAGDIAAATFVGRTGDVIAAPHLFVLGARSQYLAFPDYLTWFLNLPETQERIRALRSGSGVPFIPMEAFAQLPVPVPSIEMQNHVAGINRLCRQEQNLLEQIRERRRLLIDGLMCEAVRRETNNQNPGSL